jgi:NhaC family Na+:H+ antiporter
MMITTIPSLTIALIIFTVAGLLHTTTSEAQITEYATALQGSFNISLWLLLVPIATGIMIAKRVSSLITLFLSAAMAGVFAVIFQPHLLQQISGLPIQDAQSNFKGTIITFYGSTNIDTGNAALNDLVATRGMGGMMNTVWLIICAMCFGGAMAASGMLGSITSVLLRFMKKTVGLVASTVTSGIFFNICTADQYISIILTANMFKDIYKRKGYESRLLSRTTEDAVTVTSVLVPWNTCGMTQATILNVPTLSYLPYCFFNLISPFMSITIAALGYKIYKVNEKVESIPAS